MLVNDTLRSAEDRKILIEKQLTEIKSNLTAQTDSGNSIDSRRVRLATLNAELSRLNTIYTDKYPDIKRLKNEISEIEMELQKGKPSEDNHMDTASPPELSNNPLYATMSNQLLDVNTDIKNLKEKQKEVTKRITVFQQTI